MNEKISFYPYLDQEEKDQLDRAMQHQSCRKGQVVHRHGDSCVGLIFVVKGRLAFSILSEEGREISVFRIEKGSSCILSAACVLQSLDFESHITAEVASEIAVLPAPTLSQLMNRNHDVERLVYKQAVNQYSSVLRTMQQILFLSQHQPVFVFQPHRQRIQIIHLFHHVDLLLPAESLPGRQGRIALRRPPKP